MRVPELLGITWNYPELAGIGSFEGDQFIWGFEQKNSDFL